MATPSTPSTPDITPYEALAAVDALRRVGLVILADIPAMRRLQCVTRAELARLLGVSVGWVRQNEHEFPSTWSAGSEPRYLLSDVERLLDRRRRVFPVATERMAA